MSPPAHGNARHGAARPGVPRAHGDARRNRPSFRATLLKVLLVQAAALALLWLLQAAYHR